MRLGRVPRLPAFPSRFRPSTRPHALAHAHPTPLCRALSTEPPPLPSTVDAVVIGGGVVGASVCYHLQQQGLSTLLLEAHSLTAGTTWHSAGMLWRLRPSYVEIELHGYTRQLAIELEASTGRASWTENGGLFIACGRERLAEYSRLAQTGAFYGIEARVLSPAEAKAVHPLLRVDDVYGALHSPSDGTLDPAGLVGAYAKAAAAAGGALAEGVRVQAVETEAVAAADGTVATRVTGVRTACGRRVGAKQVVNACGAWAKAVSAMVGAELPLLAMKHAYVVTEAIEGMHGGLPNVRDHDLSIYLKAQGNALALGGYESNPEFWHTPDPSFSFGLFDLDWTTFLQNTEGHLRRCPPIEFAGVQSTVCGPESFTPDHKPLVGPQPGVRGFWQCCGFNSMGMMLSGGIGRELAAWMAEGAPSLDLFAYDPARFHAATVADARWVKERTHESYAKTYAIVFPSDEPLAGRGARSSALYDALAARGCVFQSRHGYERPGWFDLSATDVRPKPYDYYGAYAEEGSGWRLADGHADVPAHGTHAYHSLIDGELTFDWPASFEVVRQEALAARRGVALFDQSYFGKLELHGRRADEAMQWVCANDMEGKAEGAVTYTPLCNSRGGVEADVTATRLGANRWYVVTGGGTFSHDVRWLHAALEAGGFGAADVSLDDVSDAYTLLSVQGPKSHELLAPLVGGGAIDDLRAFDFSTARHVSFAGIGGVRCLRLTFVGELGFELHVPSARAAEAYAALRQSAHDLERRTGLPCRDAGYLAIDSLSAEKSYRHWHADLGPADTPLEAGIGFTVLPKLKRADAPPFLGGAALHAQRLAGLQRRLVTLVLDLPGGRGGAAPPLHGGEVLLREGRPVGIVRSTAYGHTLNASVVTGYVRCPDGVSKITPAWLREGRWAVSSKCNTVLPATLHLKPPFDPEGKRMRGEYST
ncbi:hypothetical protein AB1Y20_013648 [Prymnesium parvum]|uniref:Dimethylglycine dehydrogenase n=1 Tax=Prymnesium parvum TaxID=97485 RepID=A0AB34IIU9_PRYPA